jgi:hypothetical protein
MAAPNAYPGSCAVCVDDVPAGAGFTLRTSNGWAVLCRPCHEADRRRSNDRPGGDDGSDAVRDSMEPRRW